MKSEVKESFECYPFVEQKRNYLREFLIRNTGILLCTVISVFVDFGYDHTLVPIWPSLLVSYLRTALLWNGSMYIIQYLIGQYSIFRETRKLLIRQLMVMTIFVILVEIGEILLIEHYIGISLRQSQKISIIAGSLMVTFMISAIYFSVGFFFQWKEYVQLTQALEKANLEARYDTLRNQVNPHFLFNSLNTLLTLVDDNPAASRYVTCIADIMRYMLQSRDKEVVLLRDELNIARDYVYIQQMRFGERLKIDFDVPEKFYHYAIPPLALQMLLENALKHNVVSHEHPLSVKIHVADGAFLTIENTIKPRIDKEPSTGVGLENIRNRYIFLSGKEIQVKNQNNIFSVSLPLFEKPI